ncbi:FkbM family methyltransferase [Salmonella enterica]|nr:FkbM family methyltransferase [Salmonella enterica]EBL9103293.1 hypothetical protein [Salmonella enterica]
MGGDGGGVQPGVAAVATGSGGECVRSVCAGTDPASARDGGGAAVPAPARAYSGTGCPDSAAAGSCGEGGVAGGVVQRQDGAGMAGLPTGGQYAGAAGLAAGKGEREAGRPPAGRFYGCADAAGGGDGGGECRSRVDEPVADGTSGQGHPSGGAEASAGDGERAAVVYPVLSCGGDEGRRSGVPDRTEGEDGESVPASCAGGAGNGDGGEGNASVPRCAGTGGTAAIPGGGSGRIDMCRGGSCERTGGNMTALNSISITLNGQERDFFYRDIHSDRSVIEQNFINKEYSTGMFARDRDIQARYRDILAAGMKPVIVDCGANIGTSVLHFLGEYPQARVVALEPAPDNFALLELNTRGLDVELIPKGVSSSEGMMELVDTGEPFAYRLSVGQSVSRSVGQSVSRSVCLSPQ